MTEWVSTAAVADVAKSMNCGVPTSNWGIRKRATADGWVTRKRQGRGGGYEYHLASLPAPIREALMTQEHELPPPKKKRDEIWARFDRCPDSAKQAAQERLHVLNDVDALMDAGMSRSGAVAQAADDHGVTRRSIYRWLKAVDGLDRADRLPALAPSYKGSSRRRRMPPEAWEWIKADWLRQEQPCITACYERLQIEADRRGWEIPSKATVARRIKSDIPRLVRVFCREGEKGLKRVYPAQERDKTMLFANQWINGDGYLHNVFVKWPDKAIRRPKTWFWQDVYSGFILGYRTDVSENTDMIRLAAMDVFDRFGLPEAMTLDNTRAAANKWLSGGVKHRFRFKVKDSDPLGVFPALGIDLHWATPAWGQSKPVERSFGVGGIGELVDKHPSLSGAWCGPNPTKKPESYGSRAVDVETFLKALAAGVDQYNRREGRRTDVCGGTLSFRQAFEESYQRHGKKALTPEQRRLLLLEAEAVLVAKDGSITLSAGRAFGVGANRYHSEHLYEWAGSRVVCRFDPQDLHQPIHVYSPNGRYIAQADVIQAAGFGDTEAARAHARARNRKIRETKRAAEAERTMNAIEAGREQIQRERDEDPQTDVIRPAFDEHLRRAVGDDLVDESDEDETPSEYELNFLKVLEEERKKRRGL